MSADQEKTPRPLLWMGRSSTGEAAVGGCHRCQAVKDLLGELTDAPAGGAMCTDCQGGESAPQPNKFTNEEGNFHE